MLIEEPCHVPVPIVPTVVMLELPATGEAPMSPVVKFLVEWLVTIPLLQTNVSKTAAPLVLISLSVPLPNPKSPAVKLLVPWAVITPSVIVKLSIIVAPEVSISLSVPITVLTVPIPITTSLTVSLSFKAVEIKPEPIILLIFPEAPKLAKTIGLEPLLPPASCKL